MAKSNFMEWYQRGGAVPIPLIYNPRNKAENTANAVAHMLDRTGQMFKYNDLPETVPQRNLERLLQVNGVVFWTKAPDGNLYVFNGGMGGAPDPYYEPTLFIVANPALNFSKECRIGVDGVLGRNDSYNYGILPILNKYCALISETELTMRSAIIEMRALTRLSAGDDNTKKSAEKYLEDLESGKLGVIGENAFLDGIKMHGVTVPSNLLTQMVELTQYLRGTMYNEIGLNASFNMKREALSDGEIEQGEDTLAPLIDDMLACRKKMVEEVNAMFGTNISVELNSSWEDKEIRNELSLEKDAAEVESAEDENQGPDTAEDVEQDPETKEDQDPEEVDEDED